MRNDRRRSSGKQVGIAVVSQVPITSGDNFGLAGKRNDTGGFVVHSDEMLTAFVQLQFVAS